MVLKLLERFKCRGIAATVRTDQIVVPVHNKMPMESWDKNFICFSGWDSLELYWDPEKDKLIFRQEFGGHNELDDKDIERVIDLCMRYLRR